MTPWAAARQASLSLTIFWSLPKFMSVESVMPSNHLILCRPLLLLPSVFCTPILSHLDISSFRTSSKVEDRAPTLFRQHLLYQMSEVWSQGTGVAHVPLCLFHLSGSFTRVGSVFHASSPHLAPVGAPLMCCCRIPRSVSGGPLKS